MRSNKFISIIILFIISIQFTGCYNREEELQIKADAMASRLSITTKERDQLKHELRLSHDLLKDEKKKNKALTKQISKLKGAQNK
ncbi:MAG: hypothetical protein COA79_12610 [Planctomycetota bacterium]|nr:MAG: hypothetical protein COA79_12610 [Planctomycetota bacterium]